MSGLKHFLAELKRRHVYRVAAAYIFVGLGVLGAAELILDPLGLGAVRPVLVVLTLLGFPLALVLAWAYELKPEQPAEAATAEPGADRPAPEVEVEDVPPDLRRRSIVVLPFANLSPEAENEYFADGMTEEIINALANIPGLRVIARTSAFAFKGAGRDVREIGKQLGVGTVLEGSVRRAGDRLRITAQLIDVAGGHHLWSERYDRDLEDVFAIQDEIAGIIARRLEAGGPAPVRRERPTGNLDAYEAFLRGRFYFVKGTPESYAKSLEHYERATALDDEFAQAYTGLAETAAYWALFADPGQRVPMAKAAVGRALEIDPTLADAHGMLGFIRFFHDWDWLGSIEAFDRAMELNPESATTLLLYSAALANLGSPEAVTLGRRAVGLDPVSPQANQTLSWALFQAAEFRESIEYARRALELSPEYLLAYLTLGFALLETGPISEAEATYQEMLEIWPGEPMAHAGLAQVHVRMGRRGDAERQARELEGRSREGGGQVAISAAWTHTALGDVEEALRWVDRAIEDRDSFVVCLPSFSWWDPLRSEPRFEAILRRLEFPEWSYSGSD